MFSNFCNPKFIFLFLFFAVYLVIGSSIYHDYGVSLDEYTSRKNGFVNLKYVVTKLGFKEVEAKLKGNPELNEWIDKDYGVAFELPVTIVEILLKPDDLRKSFLIRHYAVFLTFFLSVICFYFLIYGLYRQWVISFVGSLFLVLSPRIFAHSFFNSKDLITLSFGIFAAFTLFKLIDKKSYFYSLLHGFTCALFVSLRIIGIYLPLITILVLLFFYLKKWSEKSVSFKSLYILGTFIVSFIVCFYAIWPFLWEAPIKNFLLIFENMKNFRWHGEVLYFGEFIKGSNLPWHYIPVWFAITTPVLYLILFIVGIAVIFKKLLLDFRGIFDERNIKNLILLYLFFSPIFAVILLKSTLYDAWRHLFFIYPFFLIIAVYCLKNLIFERSRIVKLITILFVLIGIFNTTYTMFRMHPHQNTYFNFFAGKDINKNFEMDYWCTSCYDGLKYILQNDESNQINVNIIPYGKPSFKKASTLLKKEEKKRIRFSNTENADYFMSNFRNKTAYNMYQNKQKPFENQFYSIKANGNEILGIYKPNNKN